MNESLAPPLIGGRLMSWGNQNSSHRGQVTGLCLVIVVSLVIPLGIAYWAVTSSMSGKPFGWHSNQYKQYSSALKNGELWFLARFPMTDDFDNSSNDCHIQRLDLETGVEYDSGIVTKDTKVWGKQLSWVGKELYLSDAREVFQVRGLTIEPLGSRRSESAAILGLPFEYDGQLTIVVAAEDGTHRLSHWINDRWEDGRKILLPGSNRVWYDDPQTGLKSLLPLTSLQPLALKAKTRSELQILKWNSDYHLLIVNSDSSFAAYRRGFEFVEDNLSIASALSPQNAPQEATGWEPIPGCPEQSMAPGKFTYLTMFANRGGLYRLVWERFFIRSTQPKILRRDSQGQYEEEGVTEFELSPRSDLRLYSFAADTNEPTSYLIRWSQHETDAAAISRIERNVIRQPHLHIPGCEAEYFARWQGLAAGLLLALISHWGILAAGVSWLTASRSQSPYEFGIQRAALASALRRGMAFVIDASLLLLVLILTLWAIPGELVGRIVWPNEVERHDCLFHIELLLYWFVKQGESPFSRMWMLKKPLQPFLDSLPWNEEVLISLFLVFVTLYVIKVYFESRIGSTIGKRLMGIRAVRTSLRPAGFARTLVRDTLCWCDIPLLLTPIPATISMILSAHRQRMGDRVADTIVIQTALEGRNRLPVAPVG